MKPLHLQAVCNNGKCPHESLPFSYFRGREPVSSILSSYLSCELKASLPWLDQLISCIYVLLLAQKRDLHSDTFRAPSQQNNISTTCCRFVGQDRSFASRSRV